MDNREKIIGVLVILGLAAFATGAWASIAPDSAIPSTEDDTGDGDAMAYWKTNDYPLYASAIRDAEVANNLPTDALARVLYQESRFRRDTISGAFRNSVGALGIAQFMPDTGAQYGLVTKDAAGHILTDNRTNPFASIAAAGRYLRDLYRMFNDWPSALMAYNWGPGNVLKYNRGEDVTVPMETSTYVAQITADVPALA